MTEQDGQRTDLRTITDVEAQHDTLDELETARTNADLADASDGEDD